MPVKVITAPTSEPLSLNEARMHLRLISDPADGSALPEDGLVNTLIAAARAYAEQKTGRALISQTLEMSLDSFAAGALVTERNAIGAPPYGWPAFPGQHAYRVLISRPPLVSITSVKYIDGTGTQQPLDPSAYKLDDYREPAAIAPVYGTYWPVVQCQPGAVLIRYVAGYANAAAVPAAIKQWMLLQIGSMYANRESTAVDLRIAMVEMPFADRLLDPFNTWEN